MCTLPLVSRQKLCFVLKNFSIVPNNLMCRLYRTTSYISNEFNAPHLAKRSANYAPLSPISLFNKTVLQYPNVASYVHGSTTRTWREVDERVKRFTSALRELDIRKNDVVSIIAPNSPSIFEAHFAVPSAGAVLHCINTRLDPETIAFQLTFSKTKVILVDSEFTNVVEDALGIMGDAARGMVVVQIFDDCYLPTNSNSSGLFNIL